MINRAGGMALSLAVVAGIGGCTIGQQVADLPTQAFVANPVSVGPADAQKGNDEPGALNYEAPHRQPAPAPSVPPISKVVRESVQTPGPEAAVPSRTDFPAPALPLTSPTTHPAAGRSTGQWEEVGTVLAVVNEEPIFADKVLSTIDRALRAEATADNEQHFGRVADDLISKQIREFIDNDLEYAAAKKSLEKKDDQIAHFVTTEWRKEQIRQAGGSEAQARQKAAEQGFDFEELVQQQYRLNVTRLYYQNKIIPLIQIAAQDMRNYYQQNLRAFQKPAAAKFRVIFVSSENAGGRDAALDKVREVARRVQAGEAFDELAGKINDDPSLMHSHGAVGEQGWMEKGAYVSEPVEQAVWKLQPGQMSDPIDAPDRGIGGFWVARLEDIHPGVSEPFESQKVQDSIREILRREQFARLRQIHRQQLIEQAVIWENPKGREATMDMVMQRYKIWTAGRGVAP